jgi:diguanylate cyclase (GGDEF)-like protein
MKKNKKNPDHVLVVEDSPTQAEGLKYILEQEGYRVSIAGNGVEALVQLKKYVPDIIISDIMMPEKDGYQLCKEIKADDALKNIPVILLTALSDPKDVLRGLECGADNFITKPFNIKYLLDHIRNIIINVRLRRESTSLQGVEIFFEGERYFITAERQQILDLLLSTYVTAVHKNLELARAQDALQMTNSMLEEKTIALSAEIAERKRIEDKLRTLSITDELTGLYNRRGFFTLADQQIKIAKRMERRTFIIYADIDGLKTINDTLGHKEGDRAIKEAAGILKETFRESDIIARMGGDEFAILQIKGTMEGAKLLKKRLHHNINAHNEQNDRPYNLSVSIGVLCYDPDALESIDEMLVKVDKMMYEQKRKKRGN